MKSVHSSANHMVPNDILTFEVLPNVGLKNEHVQFDLGLPLNQILTMLDQNVRIFQSVQLNFSKMKPYERDISVYIKEVGIRLFFDPIYQCLRNVDVDDFSAVILKYKDKIFSTPEVEEDFYSRLDDLFGPSKPAHYDDKQKLFKQIYPGLSLWFPTHPNAQIGPGFSTLMSLNVEATAQSKLKKISVFQASEEGQGMAEQVSVPVAGYCGQNRTSIVRASFENGKLDGIEVEFSTQSESREKNQDDGYEIVELKKRLRFGDDVGIVLAALGAPNKIFYKNEDKMSIHRGGKREVIQNSPHFFFNYFSMGLDVLFNFHTKKIIKFVLHTNMPGHYDFGIYSRCFFGIKLDTDNIEITNETKYPDINCIFYQDLNNEDVNKPVISRKRGPNDPFGSTYLYGIDQLVIEVMDNNHISQVTLYDSTFQ